MDEDSASLVRGVGQGGTGDGWELGPNPVTQIIAVRTAQVGGVAGVALAGLSMILPSAQVWPIALCSGIGVTLGLSAYFVATFYARTSFGEPLLVQLSPEQVNAVALTFDDGPHPETTPQLLDILAAEKAQATFFLVGGRARAYPTLTRRIADAGHTIGVHGLRHRTMVLQSGREIAHDLREAACILEDVTGQALQTRLLRPPYGFKSWTLVRVARQESWTIAAWSLDGRDYDTQTPEQLAERVTSRLKGRDIVLLHERPGEQTTLTALPVILAELQKRGLVCVGLDISGDSSTLESIS